MVVNVTISLGKGISIPYPETDSEFIPENGWLEYELVSFRYGICLKGELLVSGSVSDTLRPCN